MPARTTPLIVAHRGSSEYVAEHTFAAYEKALVDGADVLECDVRLTADAHLVCVHDRRIDRVSDGRGVVSTKTLAQLNDRDFGSWKDDWSDFEAPPEVDASRQRVLTLERLLELVTHADRSVGLLIETKHPTRYGGLVEERVAEMLRRFGLVPEHNSALMGTDEWSGVLAPDRHPRRPWVHVMSFGQIAMRRMRQLAPTVPTVFLMERVPLRFRDGSLPYKTEISGPSIEVVRAHPHYVERVHAAGSRVFVWTVDDMDDVDLCLDLGVDALITNRPEVVRSHVNRHK